MRISEVADILGMASKDVIQEVEALRDQLSTQGHKIAKRLTASSSLDDDAIRHVMAGIDLRRQESKKAHEEEERQRQHAEDERRRAEEAARRAKEEEERKKALEEARKRADEELARRQQELARLSAMATPPPAPAPPVAEAKPAVAEPAPAAPAAPVAAAPAAPSAPAPAPAQPAPPVPPMAAMPPAGMNVPGNQTRGEAPNAPRRQDGPPMRDGRPPYQGPPSGQGQRPPQGGYGQRPPQGGPGGPRPQQGGPGGPRPQGGYGQRPPQGGGYGQRPPQGGYGQRPPQGGPGGPRGGDNRPMRPASEGGIQRFVEQGFQPSISAPDEHRRRRDDTRGKERRTTPAEDAAAAARKRKTKAPSAPGAKRFRPTQLFNGEVLDRRSGRGGGDRQRRRSGSHDSAGKPMMPKAIAFEGDFTVGQFAEKLGVTTADIIKQLMTMGEMRTINQILDADLAELIATELGIEIAIRREGDEYDIEDLLEDEDAPEDLVPRPPVVTIMGHVDHGKTTLLDTIRHANVVDTEHGGITQHIGAYFVTTDKGDIVFLDTPGHEAFTAMRARGAEVTDLVVLVVAANDGVKPQTVEAISHAKAAHVPIIVAINKVDVDGANPVRVKQELMRYELVSEDLGGETIMVEVSAKKGTNVKDLLEMIALQAEVLELKANPNCDAQGTIVESHVDSARGAVATVLVERGTLHLGDYFLVGAEYGRVRAMRDDRGRPVEEAGPARPVEILGLTGSPGAGETFLVVPDENTAREIAERRAVRRKQRSARATPHVTLDNLASTLKEGEVKTLNLIVKADVQGSVEAIVASLLKIKSDKILLKVLHSGVGGVTEGDVQLADASDAVVIGFNVRPDAAARDLALDQGVEIKTYSIIYDLLEEIEKAMLGMLEPEYESVDMARIEVREIFRVSKVGNIAGCFVAEGTVAKDHGVRLVRNGTVIWTGKLASLRRHKDEAKEVVSGLECGIGLQNFNDVKVGDLLETFVLNRKVASLVSDAAS